MDKLGPLQLKPLLKRIRWGGTRLGTVLGKQLQDHQDVAESWEIVDHAEDQSVIINGPETGATLSELVQNRTQDLFGKNSFTQFPLLIKFLDAHDRLSLQVHPNNQQAKTYDPTQNGKTEAWVILDTTPESLIWLGLKEGVQREQLSEAIHDHKIEDVVHTIVPQPGDCFFVPAGTVHAIGEGILLAEVQQSSDMTFRLHDWGRMGTDGKPRPIHIQQSLNCTDYQRGPLNAITPKTLSKNGQLVEELVRCHYFGIERHTSSIASLIPPRGRFRIVMMIEGQGAYETNEDTTQILQKGDTILIPASSPDVMLTPSGKAVWLEIDCRP